MFTGVIRSVGEITEISEEKKIRRFSVRDENVAGETSEGASIAVNGVCLTVVKVSDGVMEFEVMKETLEKTNLEDLKVGLKVNLEPAMKANGRFEGHMVQGHVDTVAKLVEKKDQGDKSFLLTFELPEKTNYIVKKGSISLNGVSLTIVSVDGKRFSVGIIPYTWENTTFGFLDEGDSVNVEFDLIAKYLENYA
jgi:riboflavin synthase